MNVESFYVANGQPDKIFLAKIPCAYVLFQDNKIVKIGKTNNLKEAIKRIRKIKQFNGIYAIGKANYYSVPIKYDKLIALFYNTFKAYAKIGLNMKIGGKHESK